MKISEARVGLPVVVTNTGNIYTTYTEFAERVGHPDAATTREPEFTIKNGQKAVVLAIDHHGWPSEGLLAVIQTNERKWIIGIGGIELDKETYNAMSNYSLIKNPT